MNRFNVMLEGEDLDRRYLVTIEVLAENEQNVINLAFDKAKEERLNILGIEEISVKEYGVNQGNEAITKVYGKSYF